MSIVFSAGDVGHGNELWIADDDFANRRLLKDLSAGLASSDPTGFTRLASGQVLFVATDQIHGRELWITDGTDAGTRMLRDIGTGDGTFGPEKLTTLPDGRVVFTADDGVHGRELWVTDGTTEGTVLLADVTAGSEGSSFDGFKDLGNGRILFSVSDGEAGGVQWATDGTAAGTVKLGELMGWMPNDYVMDHVVRQGIDGVAYFPPQSFYDGGLVTTLGWRTDGTLDGTYLENSVYTSGSSTNIGIADDRWVFMNFEGSGGQGGRPLLYLKVTDGESVDYIFPDAIGGAGDNATFANLGTGKAVFTAGAMDLWVTDGTTDGTFMIADNILSGPSTQFLELGDGRVLFSTVWHASADLWVTDGTAAGTFQIAPDAAWTPHGLPETATLLDDGSVIFAAPTADGNPEAVWRVNFWEGGLERVEGVQHWTGDAVFEVARLESDLWTGGGG